MLARSNLWDLLYFIGPLAFSAFTNVLPIYLTAVLRIISTHLFLSLHYVYVDKDNYAEKLPQKQLLREKRDYLVGTVLHMWAQAALQIMFPGMFFSDASVIPAAIINTIMTHIFVVEPLYYTVHRWLHVPEQMKSMHGHHHLSINTVPSTSLVQNFQEHFIYIATFGPAMVLPYFISGTNHWTTVAAYLIVFDVVNAFGHTNIRLRNWIFENKWSPMRYLLYTPEFHLGHHAYYNCNYGLFMPIWDHVFSTYREYRKADPSPNLTQKKTEDFVFIGHNGGLGHLLTCPEVSFYNIYDAYKRTWLPLELELLFVSAVASVYRLFASTYRVSRYLVENRLVGRIICVLRTPIDYMSPSKYPAINREIVNLIREQNKTYGTRYFGLGNLNKMKQLNDGGSLIVDLVKQDPILKDKKIRIWTGDTLTASSVYHQLIDIPNLDRLFYIGANGKIGEAVCTLLVERGVKICIFSKYEAIAHPNITYTQDMRDMLSYKYVIIGKMLKPSVYLKTWKTVNQVSKSQGDVNPCFHGPQYLLDYTVPSLNIKTPVNVRYAQIGVLKVSNNAFLRGYYDICMGIDQNHIYPCHAGCIINMLSGREIDETGAIVLNEIEPIWKKATSYGLANKRIVFE